MKVVSVRGEGGSPKEDLLHRLYLIKKTTGGKGFKNSQFGDDIVYLTATKCNVRKFHIFQPITAQLHNPQPIELKMQKIIIVYLGPKKDLVSASYFS